jgi:hypothetical protein
MIAQLQRLKIGNAKRRGVSAALQSFSQFS